MNLPHKKPIKFADKLLIKDVNSALVEVSFPFIPTLSMVCESAAQSSIAFSENCENSIGYLVSLKNIEQIGELVDCIYHIRIEKSFNFSNMTEYKFELLKGKDLFAIGSFCIAIK